MRTRVVAALTLSFLLAATSVALAESSVVFQLSNEIFTCPGAATCSERMFYDENERPIYEEYPSQGTCYCDWYYYIDDFDADAIGVSMQISGDYDNCMFVDVERPISATMFSIGVCVHDELFKLCAGNSDICTQWCDDNCLEIDQLYRIGYPSYWPPRVDIQVVNYQETTGTSIISAMVVALRVEQSQPGVLPQLNPEYFNPFTYDPNVNSPLRGVQIDFTFLARSVVTVINMLSQNGYLTWIAAFAVIFTILLSFINYILRRISGGG